MNLLRFKAPALIELVTPSAAPGLFTIPLTRDVKVINAFGFASASVADVSAFQVYSLHTGQRHNITGAVALESGKTSYVTDIFNEETTLRTGWTLGIEVFGNTQASIYVWVIPLPRAA
jgi:hypothetical protein